MATILIADDDDAVRDGLAETVRDLGHTALTVPSAREAVSAIDRDAIQAVLLDLHMPGELDGMDVLRHLLTRERPPYAVVLTAFASAENTIEAMRLGAFDHLTKPIGRADIADLLGRMLNREAAPNTQHGDAVENGALIGSSDAIRRVQKLIGRAAASDATILILGETGTGKELVARALHRHSARNKKPLIAVNCAAIPNDLLESELFGHVKGAFTGALASRTGAFGLADAGTLFLDEIGDMPAAMQAKILRALQERVITPIGGTPTAVDVRVIAATNRELPSLIESGAFREDLFYRLNVISIRLPPLRERGKDAIELAEHFLKQAAGEGPGKRIWPEACERLRQYSWPGNVRELRNVVERASVLVRGDVIEAADLELVDAAPCSPVQLSAGDDMAAAVAHLEAAMIRRALDACGGNRAEAARRLKINRQLLYAKIERYGLNRPV